MQSVASSCVQCRAASNDILLALLWQRSLHAHYRLRLGGETAQPKGHQLQATQGIGGLLPCTFNNGISSNKYQKKAKFGLSMSIG
jgi:hypothetical protein